MGFSICNQFFIQWYLSGKEERNYGKFTIMKDSCNINFDAKSQTGLMLGHFVPYK